jgi:hypothetical protein
MLENEVARAVAAQARGWPAAVAGALTAAAVPPSFPRCERCASALGYKPRLTKCAGGGCSGKRRIVVE